MTLTETELRICQAALISARDEYRQIATVEGIADTPLANQFTRQAAEAAALYERITDEIG